MKKRQAAKFTTRQTMQSKDFELYYYNDSNFKRVSLHSHDFYEFYFFLYGDACLEMEIGTYELKSGDIIILPPNIKHTITGDTSSKPYKRFVLWLNEEYYNSFACDSPDYSYILNENIKNNHYIFSFDEITYTSFQTILFTLLDEIHAERFAKKSYIKLYINTLLLLFNRTLYEQQHLSNNNSSQDILTNIIEYIDANLDKDLSLDRLSAHFFVSKYYISHIFQENVGISLHQYILKNRLKACCNAIINNAIISKDYRLYGFKDYSTFYRAFKKEYKMSPTDYKKLFGFTDSGKICSSRS